MWTYRVLPSTKGEWRAVIYRDWRQIIAYGNLPDAAEAERIAFNYIVGRMIDADPKASMAYLYAELAI